MSARSARFGLGLVLVLGVSAAPAAAQVYPPPPAAPTVPPSPYAGPAHIDPSVYEAPAAPGQGRGCSSGRCTALLHRHGIHCWADHNLPTCTSCKATCVFIFGSCRWFFGEPCLSTRPLVPVPPGYQPFPYGYP
jgi:hypothetical protein